MCPLHCLSNATRVYIVLSCFFYNKSIFANSIDEVNFI